MVKKIIVLSSMLSLVAAIGTAPLALAQIYSPSQPPDNTSSSATTNSIMFGDRNGSATTGTPGIPNTGAGGDRATNAALLGITLLIVAGGITYLVRAFARD